jgi:P-type Cu+ transporter
MNTRASRVTYAASGCEGNFSANPSRYLAADPAAVTYTCPMHPEVRKDHPGVCPKCAMALEPMTRTLDDDENPTLLNFSITFSG